MRAASRIYRHGAANGMKRDSESHFLMWLSRTRDRTGLARAPGSERREGPGTNVFWRAGAGYWQQQTKVLIEGNKRRGAAVIGLKPGADGLWAVILALEELAATAIAGADDLGGPFDGMEHRLALFASAAAAEPGDDGADGQFVVDNGGKGEAFLSH